MGRERVIYPNHPEQLTWDGYKQEFPICKQDSFSERKYIDECISNLKLKLFGLIGATPKDITNDNDDPLDYITSKFINIIDDLKFLTKKRWYMNMIDEYHNSIIEGEEDNLVGTIDEDTGKEWKPCIDIVGMYVESQYSCDCEIENNNKVAEMLIQELMSYATATPTNVFNNNVDDNTSFHDVFFRTREILNDYEGLMSCWAEIYNYEFARDNWNEESHNSY